jgi:GntR family transcriptional regulator / MocR family aminotransferase
MPRRAPDITLALPPRGRGEPLAGWLYGGIRAAILGGRLRRGARVPATRELAARSGVSRGVAVAAYDRLHDEGYLVSRRGSGTVVNDRVFEDYGLAPVAPGPTSPRPVSAPTTVPGRAPRRRRSLPLCPIEPAVSEFPMTLWARLAARTARRLPVHELSRADPAGSRALREAIAAYLGASRGVACRAEQIVVVSGAQQALDLVARVVLRPGDRVWIEDPGYRGAVDALRNAGAVLVPVRVDERGLDPALGRRLYPRARAVYLTPAHQFYLGAALSLERRLELVRWARGTRAALIEDDYDSEFRYRGQPLPALTGLGPDVAFLVGTFNKVLFPSLRCGYLVVPERWLDRIVALRYQTDLYPPALLQATLTAFLDEGHFARHLRRMRELYAARRDALEDALARRLGGLLRVPEIHAGLSTPAYLLDRRSSRDAAALAAQHGLDPWALDRSALRRRDLRGLLLGFAASTERELRDAVTTLARALDA